MTVLDDKYDVSEDEIDAELESIKEQIGDDFEQTLAAQNLTEEDLRDDIENGLLQEAAMTEDIEVTDEEVETYFENQGYQRSEESRVGKESRYGSRESANM